MPSCFLGILAVRANKSILRKRRPYLAAVDDKKCALRFGLSVQVSQVRSGVRLGKPLAPHVLELENRPKVAFALLACAIADQRRPDHRDAHVRRARNAPAVLLFHEDDLLLRGKPGAAELLGPCQCKQAVAAHFLVEGLALPPREALRRVAQPRRIFTFENCTDLQPKHVIGHRVPVTGQFDIRRGWVLHHTLGIALFEPLCGLQLFDAPAMSRRVAQPRRQHQRTLQIQPDVAFVRKPHRAVHLHGLAPYRQCRIECANFGTTGVDGPLPRVARVR